MSLKNTYKEITSYEIDIRKLGTVLEKFLDLNLGEKLLRAKVQQHKPNKFVIDVYIDNVIDWTEFKTIKKYVAATVKNMMLKEFHKDSVIVGIDAEWNERDAYCFMIGITFQYSQIK